jgi:uncharacterized protein (TIGR02145 family)
MKIHISFLLGISLFLGNCKKDSTDGTVKDADGNVYHTVRIGNQTWMVENLRTTRYNDGTPIMGLSENGEWSSISTDAYCWYDNDSMLNGDTYGALYNWYAASSSKLAPEGWHVATDADWATLVSFLGGDTIAGAKLKEAGTSHWISPNAGATNNFGFTALPGGYRNLDGSYADLQISGNWWTASQKDLNLAWFRGMGFNQVKTSKVPFSKRYGFSVRCVK